MTTYITYRHYGEGNCSKTLYAGESRHDALKSLFVPHKDVFDKAGLMILESWVYGKSVKKYRVSKDAEGKIELDEIME